MRLTALNLKGKTFLILFFHKGAVGRKAVWPFFLTLVLGNRRLLLRVACKVGRFSNPPPAPLW